MSQPHAHPQATGSIPAATISIHPVERDLTLEPLAVACLTALTKTGERGSGLKVLRLVSKHVNKAFLKRISGFTLVLDGIPKNLPKVGLLRQTQLSCLRIVVTADPKTKRLGLGHLIQVQEFMAAAGPAINTVTTLELTFPQARHELFYGSDAETAAVLGPLAKACTRTQLLKIKGDVGQDLLEILGASCSVLTSLEANDVPPSNIEALSTVLPNLTSTRMSIVGDEYADEDKPEYFDEAISNCPSLVHLDAGGHGLHMDTWKLLPSCLQELIMGENLHFDVYDDDVDEDERDTNANGITVNAQIPEDLLLPHLRDIRYLGCQIPLCLLAGFLRIAPNLQRIAINQVYVPCSLDQISDLTLVHERVCAGLIVRGDPEERQFFTARHEQGIALVLQDLVGSPASLFVSSLKVYDRFASIELKAVEQPLLSGLSKAFPRLKYLKFSSYGSLQGSGWFPSLTAFSSLQVLELERRRVMFTPLELGVLCTKVPSLLCLIVASLSRDDSQSLTTVLSTWGSQVVVNGKYKCVLL